MLLMMAWIAASDGHIAPQELAALQSIASGGKHESELTAVIDIARRAHVADLQAASEVLAELAGENRRLMMQMALSMAIEDGRLTTAEIHIIRFIADLLYQSPSDLDSLFKELTGDPFPSPGDQSQIDWWQVREDRARARRANVSEETNRTSSSSAPQYAAPNMEQLRDLAILGLDETATTEDIKIAYRRMAMVHHPDKFSSLGPEAVRAAELTFQRIRAAYERLVGL